VSIDDSLKTDIHDFLRRPVRIASYNWSINTALTATFDPWTLFLGSSAVRRKTDNYARIRGNLHLRVLINSNSFYYGSLIMSYVPIYDSFWDQVTLARTLTGTTATADFVEILQRPHVQLDAATSTDADMTLPFFYPYEWFDLTPQLSGPVSPGVCGINSLNKLEHANGGTDPVLVTIYAWMEDVDLCVPTAYTAVMDSEVAIDNKSGPGMKIASSVYSTSKLLSSLPGVSPFTTPVMAASKCAYELAKLAGFSRPSVSTAEHLVSLDYTGQLSCTDKTDTTEKLALDSANAVSIAPGILNWSPQDDEMELKSLMSRWSYLTTIQYGVADAADACLANVLVRPIVAVTNSLENHYPIVSYCSLPFAFWRGTLRYKIQVVAAAMHKGRLRVVWDPYPVTGYSNNGNYFNAAYTQILDLEGEREIVIDVPYAAIRPMLENTITGTVVSNTITAGGVTTDNGTLTVYVLNPLVTPNTTAAQPVYLNIFISAGDDFQLIEPTDKFTALASFFAAAEVDFIKPIGEEDALEVQFLDTPAYPHALVVGGENVTNIRALTKRYMYSETHTAINPAIDVVTSLATRFHDSDRPTFRGHDPNGHIDSGSGYLYNYTRNNFINWFEPLFVARRGSYKLRYLPSHIDSYEAKHATVCIQGETTISSLVYSVDQIQPTAISQLPLAVYFNSLEHDNAAMQIRYGGNQQTIAVEKPYYTRFSFLPGRRLSNNSSSAGALWGPHHSVTHVTPSRVNTYVALRKYVATGEDYSLHFFVSTPVVYYYADPVPA